MGATMLFQQVRSQRRPPPTSGGGLLPIAGTRRGLRLLLVGRIPGRFLLRCRYRSSRNRCPRRVLLVMPLLSWLLARCQSRRERRTAMLAVLRLHRDNSPSNMLPRYSSWMCRPRRRLKLWAGRFRCLRRLRCIAGSAKTRLMRLRIAPSSTIAIFVTTQGTPRKSAPL